MVSHTPRQHGKAAWVSLRIPSIPPRPDTKEAYFPSVRGKAFIFGYSFSFKGRRRVGSGSSQQSSIEQEKLKAKSLKAKRKRWSSAREGKHRNQQKGSQDRNQQKGGQALQQSRRAKMRMEASNTEIVMLRVHSGIPLWWLV